MEKMVMPAAEPGQKRDPKRTFWDLSELYSGRDDPALERDLRSLDRRCRAFAKRYRGQVRRLTAPRLLALLRELERIETLAHRLGQYAGLEFATKSNDAAWGAFMQSIQERLTRSMAEVRFASVEWSRLSETRSRKLLADPVLERYRYSLAQTRKFGKHLLSVSEEMLMSKLSQVGSSSWARYHGTVLSDVEFRFRGKRVTASDLAAKLQDPDREVRREALEARIAGLSSNRKPLTFAFNMVLASKMVDDEVRHHEHWLEYRNLTNDVPDRVVETLVEVMESRAGVLRRYMRIKSRILGVKSLETHDLWAPLPGVRPISMSYDRAVDLVQDLFAGTRPAFGRIAREMFDRRHIDVPPYVGKRAGAFSSSNPGGLPYVLLNWTGKLRDVTTLAHELGHAVHAELSRKQGPLNGVQSLIMAEIASVFMETLVHEKLLERTRDRRKRLEILRQIIEDALGTTYRQIQLHIFESLVHERRRQSGELTTDEIGEIFAGCEKRFFGSSLKPYPGSRHSWMSINHFVSVPGYVYAYCASYLLVLALYRRFRETGAPFLVEYEGVLAAGGSAAPAELLGRLGVEWTDRAFWASGVDVIEGYVDRFEDAARELSLT